MYLDIGLDGTTNQAIGVMGESIFICPSYVLLKTFAGHSWKVCIAADRLPEIELMHRVY